MSVISDLIDFNDDTFRNTIGVNLTKEESYFDDLSDDVDDCIIANNLSDEDHLPQMEQELLNYNAIDYIFNLKKWLPSRFSDGTFPTWYGATEVETTFYETVFHWRQSFLSDANFLSKNIPIYTTRTVFNVNCQASLVDLRDKTNEHPYLIDQDISIYNETQKIGKKLQNEGFPGLISKSARLKTGTNLAIFNKSRLKEPSCYGHFLYEILPGKNPIVNIMDQHNQNILLKIS